MTTPRTDGAFLSGTPQHIFVAFIALGLFLSLARGAQAADPGASDSSSGPAEGELEMARAYFRNGVALLGETPPNYQDAYSQFQLALEASGGNWKVLSNLGYCAMKLERDAEAIEHYERYIEEGGAEIELDELADLQKELLLMKGNMGTLSLQSDEDRVRVLLKRESSPAPSQSHDILDGAGTVGLRAGTYQIVARAGAHELRAGLVVTPGNETSHELDFSSLDAPPPTAQVIQVQSPRDDATSKPRVLPIMGYTMIGTGALAIGAGVASFVISGKEAEKSNDIFDNECAVNAGQTFCTQDQIDDIDNADSKSRTFETLSYVGYGVGGTLMLTGLGFVIWDLKNQGQMENSEQARFRLEPEVSQTSLAARATLRF